MILLILLWFIAVASQAVLYCLSYGFFTLLYCLFFWCWTPYPALRAWRRQIIRTALTITLKKPE